MEYLDLILLISVIRAGKCVTFVKNFVVSIYNYFSI